MPPTPCTATHSQPFTNRLIDNPMKGSHVAACRARRIDKGNGVGQSNQVHIRIANGHILSKCSPMRNPRHQLAPDSGDVLISALVPFAPSITRVYWKNDAVTPFPGLPIAANFLNRAAELMTQQKQTLAHAK